LLPGIVSAALGCCLLGGCTPSGSSTAEENETHFLKGKARVSGLDFRGAIESFEEALVVNPRSAAAHFQLGWLYAEREADPAAAIYHYQKFLQLRPAAENAEIVRQHIFRLKQDLAKAMLPLPATPGVQREFEQLAEENRRLRLEIERLKGYLTARGFSTTNPPDLSELEPSGAAAATRAAPDQAASRGAASEPARTTATRTHRVQSGESPMAIARRYNVRLDAFMSANPGLNPRRLQIGQLVNVPNP
jgi:tetratricopeptide (TPR) repeat protein